MLFHFQSVIKWELQLLCIIDIHMPTGGGLERQPPPSPGTGRSGATAESPKQMLAKAVWLSAPNSCISGWRPSIIHSPIFADLKKN